MPSPSPSKQLILCVHSHQPIGNFDHVFEEAYGKSYKPFIDVLEKHPAIKISGHFSGSLLDWLFAKKPEFIERLSILARKGQLEFIGGAYYEPIYGVIPPRDLLGQIQLMRDRLKQKIGADFEGVWLTERVWDPNLVPVLNKAGVSFTILDDLHIEKTGVTGPVTGYYKAKYGKETIDIFSSMKQLRYLMPFRKADEVIDFLRETTAGPQDVFVFADDCEKFGLWPGTYDWVYREGWLDKFFTLLEKEPTVKTTHFREFRRTQAAKGIVSIPHASYSEMMEWSGGNFYNFFEKYTESGYMRDRMLDLSHRLYMKTSKNGSTEALDRARDFLYKAQCNCSYWHGVFGGLYLHHLRSAIFENIIKAEQELATEEIKKVPFSEESRLDSGTRLVLREKDLHLFFNPKYGACLEELDYLPKSVNLTCNIQRRKEVYHDAVLKKISGIPTDPAAPLSIHEILGSKEEHLENHLHYDTHRRVSFLDHFFPEPITGEQYQRSQALEIGDFSQATYKHQMKTVKGSPTILFERKGVLRIQGLRCGLELKKRVVTKGPAGFRVDYELTNVSRSEYKATFGVELNFSIGDTTAMKSVADKDVKEWILHDTWRDIFITLSLKDKMDFLAVPIETISESESGLERTFQEIGVLLQREFHWKPGETREVSIELSLRSATHAH